MRIHLPPTARNANDTRCNAIVCKGATKRARCCNAGIEEVAGHRYCHLHAEGERNWQALKAKNRADRAT